MLMMTVTLAVLAASEKPVLAVLDVQAVGAPQENAAALTDAIAQEATRRGFFQVISSNDIRTLIGVERQKELLGCGDNSCTMELSGALGARFVLQSQLTKLGDSFQLSLQMLDTQKNQSMGRSVRLAKDVRELADTLPWSLSEATATPLPPAPSKVLPVVLISGGGLLFVGAGVIGIDALSRERALRSELEQGTSGIYMSRSTYQSELDVIGRNKALALGGLIGGAAIAALGFILFPRDPAGRVALVPTFNGAALVGVWP